MAFTITIDDKLNLIIVLLIVVLWYVMFVREGYATTLECAACLQKLDAAKACTNINRYFNQEGCAKDASANALLLEARAKAFDKKNMCDKPPISSPCDGGEPAPPKADCTAATQFVYVHNINGGGDGSDDGSVYTDESGRMYTQDAQCPDDNEVIDKQVSGNGEESLYTYKCCPL